MEENINQTIQSSTILRTSSFETLPLSPNDWIMPSTSTITCIYFYDIQQWPWYQKRPNKLFISTEQLISSLQKLLEYYPLLTGVLKTFEDDNHVSVEQDQSKGGIRFVSTVVDINMNQIPLSMVDYENHRTLPPSLQLTNTFDSATLFDVRHTRFLCGSVALGICLNHQIADGHSFFQLVKDWSQLYRNLSYQPNVCHQRSLLHPSTEECQRRLRSNPSFKHHKSICMQDKLHLFPKEKGNENIVKVFRFSADELNRMKNAATVNLPSDIHYVSTFEVLTAHLHHHVMLARQHPPSTTTRLYISTNTRPRLTEPSVPQTYFGNAVMFSYQEILMEQLIVDDCLTPVSARIHEAIEQNTSDSIRTVLAWIAMQPNKTIVIPTFKLDGTDFLITAWNKMGMYSNADFEENVRPCRIILPPGTQFNSAAIFLSTEMDEISIDVALGLKIDEMQRLESNKDFRKYRA